MRERERVTGVKDDEGSDVVVKEMNHPNDRHTDKPEEEKLDRK